MSEQTNKTDEQSCEGDTSEFITHLVELRDRLLRIIIIVAVAFICLFPFANELYTLLADPLMKHMPEGTSMLAIGVVSPFLIPFKLVMLLSVVITIPLLLYQVWAFIAPGLYRNEKRFMLPLLITSTLLFYLGMAFAYYVVFPLVFKFIMGIAPIGISVQPDISHYLDFVMALFLAFGLAFEIPVAAFLLVAVGITSSEALSSARPYVIVGAFIVGMLITPPDVISQILLALPMWILYELGIVFSKIFLKPKDKERAERTTDDFESEIE